MGDELSYTLVSDKGLHELKIKGSPTVLVVDDEELMREVTSLIVEEHGCKAMLARDGQEAVELFSQHKNQISYVFLDFSMPRLNGYEAYLRIREMNPGVGVVFASGLKMTKEVEQLAMKREIVFISKPFHEVELIKALVKLQERRAP